MRVRSQGRRLGNSRLTCSHGDIQGPQSRRQPPAGQDGKGQLAGGLHSRGQARALVTCRARMHRGKEAAAGCAGAWDMHI